MVSALAAGKSSCQLLNLAGNKAEAAGDRIACASAFSNASNGDLLTVCSAADNVAESNFRMASNPTAIGEDMEAFGVAMACQMSGHRLRGDSRLFKHRR